MRAGINLESRGPSSAYTSQVGADVKGDQSMAIAAQLGYVAQVLQRPFMRGLGSYPSSAYDHLVPSVAPQQLIPTEPKIESYTSPLELSPRECRLKA